MMKNTILGLITFFLLGCEKGKEVIVSTYDNGNPIQVKFFPIKNNSQNYILKEYYENGKLSFECRVKNGYLFGTKKSFYENGNPQQFCELTDSSKPDYCCPDGFYQNYYINGKLDQTHYKVNGINNGLDIKYDTTGTKISELNILNGVRHGQHTLYYSNGSIQQISNYTNDTLQGLVVQFFESGDTLKKYQAKDGSISFPYKIWKENGKSLEGIYFNDKVEWIWRDSLNSIIKSNVVDAINNDIVIPDF